MSQVLAEYKFNIDPSIPIKVWEYIWAICYNKGTLFSEISDTIVITLISIHDIRSNVLLMQETMTIT